jgi:hypothetical protein
VYGDVVTVRVVTSDHLPTLDGPVPTVAPDVGDLTARLAAVRRLAADGPPPAFVLADDDEPVAAIVTAAVEAGAGAVVLPVGEHADGELARTVRRAADVTFALLVERGGAAR